MNKRKWLILTALAMEAKAIAEELVRQPVLECAGPRVIGIRAGRLDRGVFEGANGIILAGVGGGLDPGLGVGNVVIEYLNCPHPNPLPAYRERGPEWIAGRIFTSDHLIHEVVEKQKLFRETGCTAVDMEGAMVRKVAESINLPMIHIRAISDRADEALPEGMENWVDEVGEPRMGKVAAEVALRPYLIPALMRLQKNSRVALEQMARAVRETIGDVS